VLFVAFTVFITAIGLTIAGFEKWHRVNEALSRLQDTTAEIRVRGAFLLLMLCASLATAFGLEAILGAFLAGATLKLIDRDAMTTHPLLRTKLHAIGYGVFIPYFFAATGMNLNVRALFHDASTLERVPIFLVAILLVRGLPTVLYRRMVPDRRALLAAGFLQATSLSIPIVAGQLGVDLGLLKPDNYVALVAAGVLSVVAFPLIASTLLSGSTTQTEAPRHVNGLRDQIPHAGRNF
jgi:Kef-type K+ transport system membrane component KefB